jgi:hypothetical protein
MKDTEDVKGSISNVNHHQSPETRSPSDLLSTSLDAAASRCRVEKASGFQIESRTGLVTTVQYQSKNKKAKKARSRNILLFPG